MDDVGMPVDKSRHQESAPSIDDWDCSCHRRKRLIWPDLYYLAGLDRDRRMRGEMTIMCINNGHIPKYQITPRIEERWLLRS